GEEPVAVNCDSIQVYRGLELISGAAGARERGQLEHRLLSFVDPAEEFSAGRYAELAHAEIDALLGAGRRPIVVGGTGLYLQAALAELDLQPPVPAGVRTAVEAELRDRGSEALHAELDPELAATVHEHDRKRIARLTELRRAGIDPPAASDGLWTARMRRPSVLIGLSLDREELAQRIDRRVEAMAAAGAGEEARRARAAGVSRTAAAALGFDAFAAGDLDAVKSAHRAYARRQLSWMRRMEGVTLVDRAGLDDAGTAHHLLEALEGADDGA
ncbi:MAG: tRNA (adenosine(37)-N6)-dimethylallyltransferase MiaA, partial [Solirubrobacterales bacterium]|nr:tRNA (adenosine(37)-N6)-dimethylallyltransferase MiaA [Solirubrobacterales bacterium]